MSRPLGDELLMRTAARKLALYAASLTGAAMLVLILLVTLFVVRGQNLSSDRLLIDTAATADDVRDPPAGSWIVLSNSAGEVLTSPGMPAALQPALVSLRTRAAAPPHLTTVTTADDTSYRILTERRRTGTVQVALDLTPQHRDRSRLLRTMTVAGLVSLVVAAGLGILLSRRAVRPLTEALALQRSFVADASHELRTPLTLLSTRVQVLDAELRKGSVSEQVIADSRGVVHDVQRLGEVVEDLLIAADPQRVEAHAPVDMLALVRTVAQSATAHARAAEVSLVVDADVADGAARVSGAAAALRRAVLALVDNAIDHTPQGGRVSLSVRRDRAHVVVAVSDTGPGIPPDAAATVMRRFHSGAQRSGRAHYGLGLALTNDVADRHGGRLRLVPSQVGATFELVLPAVD